MSTMNARSKGASGCGGRSSSGMASHARCSAAKSSFFSEVDASSGTCCQFLAPPVFAGEENVGPAERGDVCEQSGGRGQSGASALGEGVAQAHGVPVDDDGGEQVEAGHAVVLALGGAVPDLALAADAKRVFQRMMGLSLENQDQGRAHDRGTGPKEGAGTRAAGPSETKGTTADGPGHRK